MPTNLQSSDKERAAMTASAVGKSMLTPEELSHRIGVPMGTLANWRTRRNAGDEIGPKFVKLGTGDPRRTPVRYRIVDVEAWEASLSESDEAA